MNAFMPRVSGMSTNRKIEWYAALNLILTAIVLAAPGDTLSSYAVYAPLITAGWSDASLATLFASVGTGWSLALYANGHWRRSPVIRCLGALAGASIWGYVSCLHALNFLTSGVAGIGLATYSLLAIFCLAACFRAAADASIAGRCRHAVNP